MIEHGTHRPQSLLVVTNWRSRALLPSEVYEPEFKAWANDNGAYIYLVMIGPKTEIFDLICEGHGWKVRTRFYDGVTMKLRTIPVSFDVIPEKSAIFADGLIEWGDADGQSHRANAVQIARMVLEHALRSSDSLDEWHWDTIRKFFTYRVEYVGQSFGKSGERTVAERIGEGHKTVQAVLAEVVDYNAGAAVAIVVMDAQVDRRESSFSIGADNSDAVFEHVKQFMSTPDGPLGDKAKLVTVAEGMLIQAFPDARNRQYKSFPRRDAPALVKELMAAGISHLGIEMDVSQSLALVRHPDPGEEPSRQLRFAVSLETGERETPSTSAPLAWRAD